MNLPPNKRSIGMVFQSYALWPHMTVRKNIAYPLKARKMKAGAGIRRSRANCRAGGLPGAAGPLPRPAERRPAAARRARSRARRAARPGPVRRAPEQPGRPAARPGPRRAPRAAPAQAVHRGVRDARPERGPRARHPNGDHARRQHRAAGFSPRRCSWIPPPSTSPPSSACRTGSQAHYGDGAWKVGSTGVLGCDVQTVDGSSSDVAVRVRPDDARLVLAWLTRWPRKRRASRRSSRTSSSVASIST